MQHRRARDMEPHWRGVIADWQASGLTIEAFCRARKIAPSQFYIWKRKIEEKDGTPLKSRSLRQGMAARAKAIAGKLKSESEQSVEFAEVTVIDPPKAPIRKCAEGNAGQLKQQPDLLTRKEAAAYLGIAEQTLAVWHCQEKYDLPIVKLGSSVRYRRADLERFLSARTLNVHDRPVEVAHAPKALPPKDASVLEIVFASGTQLKLSKACPPELLEAVITLLEVR